ncbi:magnesium transporter [Methylosinus sp. sav-2]|uniref:magnesium/cobalt transporter CorA n=1 Tax=Methylosinus sp. sav-2 TaxID=2485168 RepID=UPI00047DF03E|nr:magnesium/cobalt transporter CorA [Methylosinus sp. sav-2]TDX64328.1 magnesium transporter [Methylosinus sp. sav-2]
MSASSAAPSVGREPGVIAAAVYSDGRRLQDIEIEEAGAFAARPGHVVWIGLYEPSFALLARVQRQFDLHHLAIEDAGKAHQYPKLEQYGDGLFIVARTAQMENGRIAFGETHLFVGKGYVLSIRHGASSSYAQVRERCEAAPHGLSEGEDYIVYAILDFIVDNYFPVLATINAEVEEIEDHILAQSPEKAHVDRLYALRRDLLRLGNAVAPLVDVCQRLEHTEVMAIDAAMRPHFRDVTDHILRVREQIATLREVLAFAFEASLMNGQMQQTHITRRLAAWAAILAVPTAIAGIYGMNFEHMPELKWRYGYFLILAATATICATLYWRFRRNDWL